MALRKSVRSFRIRADFWAEALLCNRRILLDSFPGRFIFMASLRLIYVSKYVSFIVVTPFGSIFFEKDLFTILETGQVDLPGWSFQFCFFFFGACPSLSTHCIHFHLDAKVMYPFLITFNYLVKQVFTLSIVQDEKLSHSSKAIHFVIICQDFWDPSHTHFLLFLMFMNDGHDGSVWPRIPDHFLKILSILPTITSEQCSLCLR